MTVRSWERRRDDDKIVWMQIEIVLGKIAQIVDEAIEHPRGLLIDRSNDTKLIRFRWCAACRGN